MLFKEIESINGELKWADFYLNLGRLFGEDILNDERVHNIFLKIPYIDYIPHMIALGIADSIYETESSIEDTDLQNSLEKGMTIYYRPTPNEPEIPCIFLELNDMNYPVIEDMKENKTVYTLGKFWKNKIRIANEHVVYKKSRTLNESLLNNIKKYYPISNINNIAQFNKQKVLIIGNETKLKIESEAVIQDLPLYNWLLLKQYLHPQLFSLCNIYSSKFKGDLEELSDRTIVIYTNLESFFSFNEELKEFSSIILFSPIDEQNFSMDALTLINDFLDSNNASDLIEETLTSNIPKGVDMATWKID